MKCSIHKVALLMSI